ncbi:hypothetical protein AB3X52_17460 [Nocardioides sp. DS6]|uniref:Uncharacterized protein n=1 Tax=Nocardioides eburneus TaxID=3231482 RepID=A0ABV3T2I1_9ACTN
MASRGRSAGKRAGARRGPRQRHGLDRRVLLLAGAITIAIIAWGYLVYAAIDFGGDARDGEGRAWAFLALAAVGAVACLFAGLMLLARLGRALGLTSGPAPASLPPETRPSDPTAAMQPQPAPDDDPGTPAPTTARRHRAD